MFIWTVRASAVKFFATVFVALAALLVLVAFIPTYTAVSAEGTEISYKGVNTNRDRHSFAAQFGWEIGEQPVEEVSVTVPKEFDAVYTTYNELQKLQGLNLEKYKGKTVWRYTYEISNYPDYNGTVYISMLVYRGRVIAGDVCSASASGFVHGFDPETVLP